MAENTKQSNKERLKDITDSIERGIEELFQSDKYAEYLRTMSRFHKYSVNNTMLIYMQRPDATLVAGFNKWRDQFGRNVMKGEKGIKIIAPTPFKKKIEQEKRDPDTNLPMLDADGKVIVEEKEIKIPMYKPVTVFDVSQTDGKPLPQLASDLSGNVQNYEVFMEALRRSAPVPIEIIPIRDGSDGYFSLDNQKIAIREGMSEGTDGFCRCSRDCPFQAPQSEENRGTERGSKISRGRKSSNVAGFVLQMGVLPLLIFPKECTAITCVVLTTIRVCLWQSKTMSW